jgi:hypothetical protein
MLAVCAMGCGQGGGPTDAASALARINITGVSPGSGVLSGGTRIKITGQKFTPDLTVTISGEPATGVTVVSPNEITCITPPGSRAGPAYLQVTSPTAGVAVSAGGFSYNPDVTLNVSRTFGVGGSPRGIASADLDRNGVSDLVVSNSASNTLSVMLGDGAGVLAPAAGSPVAVAGSPTGVVVADVNRDGSPDVLVASSTAGDVKLLVGDGAGGFTPGAASPFVVGGGPPDLVAGDFNRDGSLDIAVCNETDGTVTVLLGNGSGGFSSAPGSPVAVGTGPRTLATAELTGDAILDLVVVNSTAGSLSVLRGDGAGRFTAAAGSPITVGSLPTSVAIADLDRNGRLDLAVANRGSGTLSVLLGDGSGGFTAAGGSPLTLTPAPESVALSEMDGDGVPDVVVSTATNLQVLTGKGPGTFFPAVVFPGGSALLNLILRDMDRDGRPDVSVIGDGAPGQVTVLLNSTAWIGAGLLGTPSGAGGFEMFGGVASGDLNRDGLVDVVGTETGSSGGDLFRVLATAPGTFGPVRSFVTAAFPTAPVLADVDRDGALDCIVGKGSTGRDVGVYRGDGTGSFATPPNLVPCSNFVRGTAVGDFNRDGRLDIVVRVDSAFDVHLGDGTGGFSLAGTVSLGGFSGSSIAAGDLDRNGTLDVVTTDDFGNSITVFLGNGSGGFAAAPGSPISLATGPGAVAIDDLDRNGIPDLAVGSPYSSTSRITVYLGSGSGAFTLRGTVTVGASPNAVASLDLNRDGRPDLAVANLSSGTVSVLQGNGLGDFPVVRSFLSSTQSSPQPSSLSVADATRDGLADLIVGDAFFRGFTLLAGR